MTSSPTTRNRFNNQSTGSNRNTWGSKLNNEVNDLVDESLDGFLTKDLTGGVTLTSTNYVSDEARKRVLRFTDTGTALTGTVTVTLPTVEKNYFVINDTLQTVTFDAGGTSASVEAGRRKQVAIDSSGNVYVGEDGADKEYVDAQDALRASLTGGNTFTGDQTINGNVDIPTSFNLTVADAPANGTEVANKDYVDGVAMGSVSVSMAWADITGKPTTIGGFGITDAYTKTETYTQTEADALFAAKQPLDSDLTSIAALTTTARGRNELTTPVPIEIDNTDSPYAASFGEAIFVDCSSGAVEIDLPAATAGSLPIQIIDDDGSATTNNITIDPDGAETISGQTTIEVDQARARLTLVPFAGLWRLYK